MAAPVAIPARRRCARVRRRVGLLVALAWVAACTSPASDGRGDARFVVVSAAVVRDVRTGLEWTRRDDGTGLDSDKADAYCRTLSIDGGGGWRLPDIEELQALRGGPPTVPCGTATCAIDPAFTLTSPYVWSATIPAPTTRTYLDFQFGTRLSPTVGPQLVRRVLCVRTSGVVGLRRVRSPMDVALDRAGGRASDRPARVRRATRDEATRRSS